MYTTTLAPIGPTTNEFRVRGAPSEIFLVTDYCIYASTFAQIESLHCVLKRARFNLRQFGQNLTDLQIFFTPRKSKNERTVKFWHHLGCCCCNPVSTLPHSRNLQRTKLSTIIVSTSPRLTVSSLKADITTS